MKKTSSKFFPSCPKVATDVPKNYCLHHCVASNPKQQPAPPSDSQSDSLPNSNACKNSVATINERTLRSDVGVLQWFVFLDNGSNRPQTSTKTNHCNTHKLFGRSSTHIIWWWYSEAEVFPTPPVKVLLCISCSPTRSLACSLAHSLAHSLTLSFPLSACPPRPPPPSSA